MSIADAQRGTNQPKDEVPEDGWSTSEGEGEEFVGSHTTVDPNLLSRLAALDKEKADKKGAGGPAPLERRDKTVTLDIGDLEFGEDPEAAEVEEASEPVKAAPEPEEAPAKAPFAPAPSAILPMTPPAAPPAAPSGPTLNPAVALMGNAKPKKPRPEMVHQTQAAGGMSGVMSGSMSGTASAAPTRAPEAVAAPAASIEVDREFASEKTQIFVPAMDDEPTKAKLKVVQGGGQQKEYLLARDRITIGRGTNNDILVPDIAMSRQHCEIKRMPDGRYRVGDLQSGNGTKLNGLRVLDADLFGGDRIEVGNTILEFVLTGPGASRPPSDRKINYHPSETPPAKPASNPGRMSAPSIAPVAPNYSGGGQSTVTHLQVAPPPSSSNVLVTVLIVGLGLIFVALALVIGATIYLDSNDKPTPPVAGTPSDDKPAQDYYFEGIEFVKKQDWDKAEEKFSVAADLGKDEHDFQTKKNAELQLERVRKEKTNQKALLRGKELLEQGGFEDAIARLDTIRSGSVYYDEARSQGEQARQRYAKQLTEQAQVDFDAKEYDEADRKVLLALSQAPEFPAAKELQGKIAELPSTTYVRPEKLAVIPREVKPGDGLPKDKVPDPKDPKDPKGADPKDPKVGGDPLAVKDPKDPKGADPGDKPDDKKAGGGGGVANFTQGLLLYRSRKYGEAQAFFDKIGADDAGTSGQKAKTLSSQIGEFQQAYNAGNQAFQGSDYVGAARFLTNAYRLDKAISGSGYHGEELRKKLSESNYQQAQAAFNGNNYQRAGSLLKQALTYEGGHAKSLQLLEQIEGKAKSLYIDAVNKKKSDPAQAKRIAQTIVVMLPESAETHQKAKQLLQELGP